MSEARRRHIGKTEQERQAYLNWLKDGGTTSRTPHPRSATDELPDTGERGTLIPTQRPSVVPKQTVLDYVKENVGSVFLSVFGISIISAFGYFFIELNNLNREMGEMSTFVQGQTKRYDGTVERIERKIDSAIKGINDRLSRNEDRLDRHYESSHPSP